MQQILDAIRAQGFGADAKAGDVLAFLKTELDLGRGHGMPFVHVLKNGPTISDKHVGTTGSHRDESTELRLDGIAARQAG